MTSRMWRYHDVAHVWWLPYGTFIGEYGGKRYYVVPTAATIEGRCTPGYALISPVNDEEVIVSSYWFGAMEYDIVLEKAQEVLRGIYRN